MPTISTLTVDVQSRTNRFSSGLKVAIGGLAALATGAAFAFNKFEESQNVIQQTRAVLESTGGVANVTAKEVGKLADALSRKTGIDDEQIASGENMLLTFKNIRNEAGKGNDIFNQTTKATLDMAAAMAAANGGTIDLKSSSIQLGKALNDPVAGITALTRVGVTFTEDQKKQIEQLIKHNNLLGAQKLILKEVTSEFEGSAHAQKTAAGTAAVAFENLAETIGGLLAPAIQVLADGLNDVLSFLQEEAPKAWDAFTEGITKAWDAVKPFAQAIGNVLIPLFEKAWNAIREKLLPALERLKPLFVVIGAAVVLFASVILAQLALVITAVSFVVDAFLDFLGFIRDKVVEPVVNALGRVVEFLKGPFTAVWDNVVRPIGRAVTAIIGWIQRVIDKLQEAIDKALDFTERLAHLAVEAGVFADIEMPSGGAGSRPPGFVPGVASGGFVARSGLAVIHRGETVVPAGGGIAGDINLVLDGKVLARVTRDQLNKLGDRNAGTGLR